MMKEKQRKRQPIAQSSATCGMPGLGCCFRNTPSPACFAVDGAGIGAVSADRQPAARDDCGNAGKAEPCRICSGRRWWGLRMLLAQVGTECAQPGPCLLYNGVPQSPNLTMQYYKKITTTGYQNVEPHSKQVEQQNAFGQSTETHGESGRFFPRHRCFSITCWVCCPCRLYRQNPSEDSGDFSGDEPVLSAC